MGNVNVLDLRAAVENYRLMYGTAWHNGVMEYAVELLTEYEENHGKEIEMLNEEILLRGAPNWERYSMGGCSLIRDEEIAERVCSQTQMFIYDRGNKPPVGMRTLRGIAHSKTEWLEVQAYALHEAARFLVYKFKELARTSA